MAKNKSRGLGRKQFFTMSVLAVSVLGLIFVTSAAMTPTNTQSDASNCTKKPTWVVLNSDNAAKSVTYHVKLVNNCPEERVFLVAVSVPASPTGWTYKFANGDLNKPIKKRVDGYGSSGAGITVSRENIRNITSGKYNVGVYALPLNSSGIPNGDATWVSLPYSVKN